MPLLINVIEDARSILLGGMREERNKLASSTLTTLTMTYPLGSIKRGSRLSIDLEDFYVWDTASQVVTADGNQFGSPVATHANGSIVYVNPRYSNWEIFKAVNKEIVALSSPAVGLFRVVTTELTYSPAVQGYNFDLSNVLDVLEVRYSVPGTSLEYPLSHDWEIARDMSDEFTSGGTLVVRDAFPHRTVLVKAKLPFTQFPDAVGTININTDVATTGLPTTAYDLLSIGAAWRLSSSLEISRNDYKTQGDTRRADEVPPGAILGGSRELARHRQLRINEEVARLNQKYPKRLPRYPYHIPA